MHDFISFGRRAFSFTDADNFGCQFPPSATSEQV
jgi:hypothetical protein